MSRLSVPSALLLLALSIGACSKSEGGGFTLEPATAHVTAGGPAISFEVVTTGKAGAVIWNLDGPGRFAPDGGLGGLYTPPDAVDATARAVLSAEMNDAEHSSTITIDPMPAVSGRVVGLNGLPIAGAAVIADSGGSTTADASGAFTLAGVKAPYAIAATDPTSKRAVALLGLRRSDPTLVIAVEPGTTKGANVTGTLSGGGGFPAPAGCVTRAAFGGANRAAMATVADATGSYVLPVTWWGEAPSLPGEVQVLQWMTDATGRPTGYTGWGSRTLDVAHGQPVTGHDISLQAVQTATLTGTASESVGLHLDAIFPSGARIPLLSLLTWDSPGRSFGYLTPRAPGVTLELIAVSNYAGDAERLVHKAGLAPDATGVSLVPFAMPWPAAPAHGATVSAATVFSWSAFGAPRPVYLIAFRSTLAGGPFVDVITNGQQLRLADAAALGFAVPAGSYTWEVNATTAVGTVDEAAAAAGFYATATEYQRARTGARAFTLAP